MYNSIIFSRLSFYPHFFWCLEVLVFLTYLRDLNARSSIDSVTESSYREGPTSRFPMHVYKNKNWPQELQCTNECCQRCWLHFHILEHNPRLFDRRHAASMFIGLVHRLRRRHTRSNTEASTSSSQPIANYIEHLILRFCWSYGNKKLHVAVVSSWVCLEQIYLMCHASRGL